MAYLDGYDGAHWRFAATFQPTGGRVPTSPAAGNGPAVTQQIEISGPLPVPLLPALDRPVSVTGAAVADDPTTGMLLPQGAQRGDTYTVVSRAPAVSLPELAPADGIDPSLGGAFDLQTPPDTAADLAIMMRYLSTLDGGAHPAGTVAFLQSALHALQTDERRIDPAAGGSPGESGLAGTSLSEVIDAVTVDHAATPEQLATFLALIARELGVPARVATGFRLAGSSDGRLVGPGTYRVTSRQAWAWVEIPGAGVGWGVCDPAPDAATTAASPVPESESAPATTLPPRPAEAIPRSQVTAGHALAPPTHLAAPRPRRGSAWIVVASVASGLALMLVSGGPAAAALRRWRRRRRRRSTDPSALAVGAWLELLDGLDRAGMSCSSASTASEVARETGHHFGSDFVQPAAMVAALADRAVFSTTARIGPREALEAWDRVRELRRQLRAGLDVRQRIRYSLLVGSAPSRPSATAAD
jgi:hypothetical protein